MRFAVALIFSILFMFVLLTEQAFAVAGSVAPIAPTVISAATTAPSITKSFSDWKGEKILNARKQLNSSSEKLASLKQKKASQQDIQQSEAQVSQDQWALEMTEDLTSTDYLVLYLSVQNSPEKFKEAAAKLSPEETAKVLEAYLSAVGAQQTDKNRAKLPRHSDQSL